MAYVVVIITLVGIVTVILWRTFDQCVGTTKAGNPRMGLIEHAEGGIDYPEQLAEMNEKLLNGTCNFIR